MNLVLVRYAFPSDYSEESLQSRREVLSVDELEHYNRFKYAKHRHQYLAAHMLLRQTLSKTVGIEPSKLAFGRHPLGKPFLFQEARTEPIEFSLTHTEGIVACAISSRRVGIDAEWTGRKYSENLVKHVLSPLEQEDVEQCASETRLRRFLVYWTLKESILKATGKGLTIAPRNLQFAATDLVKIRMEWISEKPIDSELKSPWRFELHLNLPQHVLAVAAEESESDPPTFSFEPCSLLD